MSMGSSMCRPNKWSRTCPILIFDTISQNTADLSHNTTEVPQNSYLIYSTKRFYKVHQDVRKLGAKWKWNIIKVYTDPDPDLKEKSKYRKYLQDLKNNVSTQQDIGRFKGVETFNLLLFHLFFPKMVYVVTVEGSLAQLWLYSTCIQMNKTGQCRNWY
jgi:hypothetical protein